MNPVTYKDEERPLIVIVHGGPHANARGDFSILELYFLALGYNVLFPNFTGSIGFGQNYIEKLLTKIGDIDAKEIIGMID